MLLSAAQISQPVFAQTTDFGTTSRTFILPKGTKVDPRYLLRREKPDDASDNDAATAEDPQIEAKQKISSELDARLLGAWTRVSSVSKQLTEAAVRDAARRCLQQLKLKPLRFETNALRQLPDIDALFGDLVYYRTSKGLQRLDINSGQIRFVADVSVRKLQNSQLVWTLKGQNMKLRIRFSNPIQSAPKARFMLEESGFYLRCPSKDDELFNDGF